MSTRTTWYRLCSSPDLMPPPLPIAVGGGDPNDATRSDALPSATSCVFFDSFFGRPGPRAFGTTSASPVTSSGELSKARFVIVSNATKNNHTRGVRTKSDGRSTRVERYGKKLPCDSHTTNQTSCTMPYKCYLSLIS